VSVARQLWLALGLNALLLLLVVAEHVRTIERAVATAHELSEVSAQVLLAQVEQGTRLALLEETVAKYAVTRDAGYLAKLDELRDEVTASLSSLDRMPLASTEQAALLTLSSSWEALQLAGIVSPPPTAGRGADSLATHLSGLLPQVGAMREHADDLARAAQHTMRERLASASLESAQAVRLSWLAALVAALLVLVTALLVRRAITTPLAAITEGTRTVARGEFDHRLDVRGPGEFAEVAASFNSMTQQLGALDRLKRDFVTSVSHDLKSPLASLRETGTLLLDEVPGPLTAAQRRVLLLQRESADRLGRMIAKLLDLSRLEAGVPLVREPVEVKPFLERSIAHAGAAARPQNVAIALSADTPDGLVVSADEDRLRHLVDNLLENAVKFSPDGATVQVAARLTMDRGNATPWLELDVADRGPGVASADRARIFDRFAQTATGRSVANRGAGIGLTICREVVQAHGGSISVEARDGGGSVFRVRVPGASVQPTRTLATISSEAVTA
jgi:signal transduction histidine kinase